MKHHILTTGISILTNFINSQEPRPKMEEALRRHKEVAKSFLADPTRASAEVNSLNSRVSLLAAKPRDLGVTLIYTTTPEGKLVASLLEGFLKRAGVKPVHRIPLKGLDAPAGEATPEWAKESVTTALEGMRQGVTQHIARLRRQSPGVEIELNCTGGYKAEVAVLYELGRTLRVPVYYLHESFKVCVTLP